MTLEMGLKGIVKHFEETAKDCPWVSFHVTDVDIYDGRMDDEMIHAYIVIPQWTERPRVVPGHFENGAWIEPKRV